MNAEKIISIAEPALKAAAEIVGIMVGGRAGELASLGIQAAIVAARRAAFLVQHAAELSEAESEAIKAILATSVVNRDLDIAAARIAEAKAANPTE